ncbi:hypothetical protein TREMEDRAFT_60753 [Tremella mesenterica DSM 1558]|uniref:uncharacterized protein n=1 Tax=Tremella mesenterica (strain ATCC 24925 / CBS 8224 / DSM 1558 / NBRC 9311 / NRRL Y-6157 / RJB 2259-6 / UBC 559-6) TaxID=578456 RepID=UPI0003F48EE8|nr:uncharacterized protein TREMEDRAFT_60753 [Tremella mesenterica DSM 1558]EIW71833.1 hypothetical protein TREMEDRAFT_60753 [Tremella mesenterica DSM 1558]
MGHAKWACKEHLPTAREIFCSQVETLGFKTCGRTTQVPIITGILDKEENLLIPPIPLFQMTKVDSDGTEQLVACCSLACAVEHVLEGWTKRNMSDDPLAECQERISNAKGIGLLNYGPEAGDTLIDMEPMREKSMNAWSTESKGQSDEELSGDSDNASVDNESAANPKININDKNTDNADDDGDSDHKKDLQDGRFIDFTSTSQLLKALMGEVGEQISESIHPLNDMGICICNSQKQSSAAEIWTTKVSSKFVSSCKHDGDNFRIPVAIISEVSEIGDMVTVQVLYPMKRILADGTKEQIGCCTVGCAFKHLVQGWSKGDNLCTELPFEWDSDDEADEDPGMEQHLRPRPGRTQPRMAWLMERGLIVTNFSTRRVV